MSLTVVFMGTAPFAVPCLDALHAAGYRVRVVVSQPDRPRGRGLALQPSAVKARALELGLPVLQPEKASAPEFVEALQEARPDLAVVVAYGQILRQRVLDIPRLGCINVHGSLLPRLRGAAPIQWSILNGDAETGVTTMWMDAGMDTGDIMLKRSESVRPEDTAGALADRLAPLGAKLLLETLDLVQRNVAPREPQDPALATYAPMLTRETGAIDWSQDAVAVRNRIHGCNPSPGAFARRLGEPVKLWRAEAVDMAAVGATVGSVVDAAHLTIAAGRGAVRLLEVQPPGRKRMSGAEFARGYHVESNEIWQGGREPGDG